MIDGNVNEPGDVGEGPGKSYLFFLTVCHPEIDLFGDRVPWLVELGTSAESGASSTALENPGSKHFTPGRTDNRSRSPRLTASS